MPLIVKMLRPIAFSPWLYPLWGYPYLWLNWRLGARGHVWHRLVARQRWAELVAEDERGRQRKAFDRANRIG